MIWFIYALGVGFTAGLYVDDLREACTRKDRESVGDLAVVLAVALLWPVKLVACLVDTIKGRRR